MERMRPLYVPEAPVALIPDDDLRKLCVRAASARMS